MSATNVARAGKRGNICVGNNVSSFVRVLNSLQGLDDFALCVCVCVRLVKTRLNELRISFSYEPFRRYLAAISMQLNSVVSNTNYGILRGQITRGLAPDHSIIAT